MNSAFHFPYTTYINYTYIHTTYDIYFAFDSFIRFPIVRKVSIYVVRESKKKNKRRMFLMMMPQTLVCCPRSPLRPN